MSNNRLMVKNKRTGETVSIFKIWAIEFVPFDSADPAARLLTQAHIDGDECEIFLENRMEILPDIGEETTP